MQRLTNALLIAFAATAHAQPVFLPLGDLPGGEFFSFASALNADGTVVSGSSDSPIGQEPFVWTEAGGLMGIGKLYENGNANFALGVSDDGSVVVGTSGFAHSPSEGFMWTSGGGLGGLGDLPGAIVSSAANAISGDGQVIVGQATDDTGLHPSIWTERSGWQPIAPGNGEALGVSADGSIVVGSAWNPDFLIEAFRWTEQDGMLFLGDFPEGELSSAATGISAGGDVIVGWGTTEIHTQAFRWTEGDGLEKIADTLPGATNTRANGVSDDGNVIVGDALTPTGYVPFLWTPDGGAVFLQDLLIERGTPGLEGWELGGAAAVSGDGRTIVGSGFNPQGQIEAYLVRLEAGCPGDVNGDGALNVLDFVAFQVLWQQQDVAGDCDGNGAFSILDFVCFQQAFTAGCP